MKNKLKIISISILFAASMSLIAGPPFLSVLADPFGIFNYDNPVIVKLQGLRAHLFEAHDATHNANLSEIIMHLKMAGEEIPSFLENLTSGELDEYRNTNLSTTLQTVQMQLNETGSIANVGNMSEVMSKLKQADQYLATSLDELGYSQIKNLTFHIN